MTTLHDLQAQQVIRQAAGNHRRAAAIDTLADAQALAAQSNLRLTRKSPAHYQLEHLRDRWLINLYPGNCRIYPETNRPRPPFLNFVGVKWTLIDVVRAAREVSEGENRDHC